MGGGASKKAPAAPDAEKVEAKAVDAEPTKQTPGAPAANDPFEHGDAAPTICRDEKDVAPVLRPSSSSLSSSSPLPADRPSWPHSPRSPDDSTSHAGDLAAWDSPEEVGVNADDDLAELTQLLQDRSGGGPTTVAAANQREQRGSPLDGPAVSLTRSSPGSEDTRVEISSGSGPRMISATSTTPDRPRPRAVDGGQRGFSSPPNSSGSFNNEKFRQAQHRSPPTEALFARVSGETEDADRVGSMLSLPSVPSSHLRRKLSEKNHSQQRIDFLAGSLRSVSGEHSPGGNRSPSPGFGSGSGSGFGLQQHNPSQLDLGDESLMDSILSDFG